MAASKSFSGALLLLVLFIFAIVGMFGKSHQLQYKFSSEHTIYCVTCQDKCIAQCKSQGRVVSQLECNFWGSAPAVCKCCCGLPSSTPTTDPTSWVQCPAEEKSQFFALYKVNLDCNLCINGCKTRCDAIGAKVTREVCFQSHQQSSRTLVANDLLCPCCCKPNPPPSPPPPPPPSPPICPPSTGPSCGSCGVDVNIQISSTPGQQAPCECKL
ncbi:hypothetical protein MKW98_014539 [Papaver atlanticum]|uniref:Uncharacterized protein n=1 Tax=Papaver atlanticum TaxID=357466 RepID=A0AAD4S9U7_9MAGN|nr:hypothetical protein MKW98_014539 [Papaver atlanticum]